MLYFVIFVAALVLGCASSKELTVKYGDTIAIEYNLTLEDGTLIDTTVNKTPFVFVVGSQDVIKGLSYGVIGMAINETKRIVVEPKDAYGEYNSSLVKTIPSNNSNLTVGQEIISMLTKMRGRVIFVNSTHVTADFNHPLAGKTLIFVVKVVNITETKDYFNP